jgi:hypothetical protein
MRLIRVDASLSQFSARFRGRRPRTSTRQAILVRRARLCAVARTPAVRV